MHELFEHTADLGLRMRAESLDALFVEAAQALFDAIVTNPEAIRCDHPVDFDIPGDERDFLLFDWLRALLLRFDTEQWLFGRFEVAVGDTGLTARAWGEVFDPARHVLEHEVKAITYHRLRVEQVDGAWEAEVIVDI